MVVGLAFAGLLTACGPKSSAVSADDMSLGDPKSAVTVVEYASLSCSHCARFSTEVFPEFRKKYIDTNKVHYVFREFLTAPADVAAGGALLARCSGKDKYFNVIEAIYAAQPEMFADGTAANALPVLKRIGQSVGLNDAQFSACVGDEKALAALNARVDKYGKEANITATPTFVINGEKVSEGEMTMAQLDAAIAKASAAKK